MCLSLGQYWDSHYSQERTSVAEGSISSDVQLVVHGITKLLQLNSLVTVRLHGESRWRAYIAENTIAPEQERDSCRSVVANRNSDSRNLLVTKEAHVGGPCSCSIILSSQSTVRGELTEEHA